MSHRRPSRSVHSLLSDFLRWTTDHVADVEVTGLEHIPAKGGAVLVANHRSVFDAFVLGSVMDGTGRDVMVLAKAELFDNKLLGRVLRKAGVIPVHRGTAQAVDSLNEAVASLKGGELVALFPEGTIPTDGQLTKFKTGATRMALEAGVPVIPVTMIGTNEVIASNLRRAKRTMWRRAGKHANIQVIIGKPVRVGDMVRADALGGPHADEAEVVRHATDGLRALIDQTLEANDPHYGATPPMIRKREVTAAMVVALPVVGLLARRLWNSRH